MIPFKKIRLAYIEEAEEDFVPMPDLYIFKFKADVQEIRNALSRLFGEEVSAELFGRQFVGTLIDPHETAGYHEYAGQTYARVGTPTKPDAVFLATDVPNKIGDYMFDCAPSQKNETLTIDILNKLIKLNRTFEQ